MIRMKKEAAAPTSYDNRNEQMSPLPQAGLAAAEQETDRDAVHQRIAFTPSRTGHRLAYAISGSGYPIVRAPNWLTHLEADWQTASWRPLLTDLSSRYQLVRFDQSGTGLSDPTQEPVSLDSLVDDLAAVVDAARLERFALFGMSQGAAVSIRYAARHPDRVSHLVLCGGYVRGTLTRSPDAKTRQMVNALCDIVLGGWAIESSAYRQIFTTQFFPGASREQIEGFNRLEGLSSSPERAAQMIRAFSEIDASEDLKAIRCPTLVFHTRRDARIDFEEGRFIASGIAGARLIPLDGPNHLPLGGDPAYARMLDAIRGFLPFASSRVPRTPELSSLNPKERELFELLARGLDNAQIAAHLNRADKTVRNRMSALFETLQVENRPQAIVLAHRLGLGG